MEANLSVPGSGGREGGEGGTTHLSPQTTHPGPEGGCAVSWAKGKVS